MRGILCAPRGVYDSRVRRLLIFVGILIGLIGDTIAANRRLTEEILYRLRRSEERGTREKPS